MDFRRASTWAQRESGVFSGEPPQRWAQGRAMYGGLVAAIALRPMLALVPAERWLRTLSVSFVAPLNAAPAECHSQVLRAGRALSTLESRIVQDGTVRCVANATFAADRPSSIELAAPRAPALPPDTQSVELPYMEGLTPAFLQYFTTRWDNGVLPGSGSLDAHIVGACRFKDEARDADICDVIGVLDAWPPAPITMLKSFASAASTVSWTVDFPQRTVLGRTTDWWRYEVRAVAMTGGYGQTQAWLWDPQGNAIARSTQLVAVFE